MRIFKSFSTSISCLYLLTMHAFADLSDFSFEGVATLFGIVNVSERSILKHVAERIIMPCLPYNPVILDASQSRQLTNVLLSRYPKGVFFAFIPEKTFGLDEICLKHGIQHVDLIRWDAEELERIFIKSALKVMQTASVLSIKTGGNYRKGRVFKFVGLKKQLENIGFCLITHYYKDDFGGEAVFIKKEIYDALF